MRLGMRRQPGTSRVITIDSNDYTSRAFKSRKSASSALRISSSRLRSEQAFRSRSCTNSLDYLRIRCPVYRKQERNHLGSGRGIRFATINKKAV
jgi:hypothetical protein